MGWKAPPPPRKPWTSIGTRKIIRQASPEPEHPRDWRELAHPDLQLLDDATFRARSDWLSAVVNRVPEADRIHWYGGMKRSWKASKNNMKGDGGNGAWMTTAQAEAWLDRTDSGGVVIGHG
jgi:hypothetical protein